jgi:general secretion pathway protein A
VHGRSGGVPRLINLVCDRALLAGFVAGTREIDVAMVRRAAMEVEGKPAEGRRWRVMAGTAAAATVLIALASFLALRRSEAHPPAAAAAIPVTAPATTVPAAPATDPLEPLVLSLDREASRRGALAAVQGLWGSAPLEMTALNTHLDQIRRLNLPVVLEMVHPARRDPCYLALLRMDGDTAEVAAGAAPMRVSVSELDRLWTRQAFFLWRDFEALATSEPARTADFARASLGRLGYLDGARDLSGAVARFQRDTELAPDGIVGARTLMALYSLGAYARPRLGRAGRVGGAS